MPFNGVLPRMIALWGLALAIVCKIAPGEPAWMTTVPSPPAAEDDSFSLERFTGGDGTTLLTGRLYKPVVSPADVDENNNSSSNGEDSTTTRVVVFAHGLGLTQESWVQPFVRAFTQAGLSVFTFDYATFGLSDGWPRHEVIPNRHVADLRAAVSHVRKLHRDSDSIRIGLVGLSLGGGHVLTVAADNDKDIVAVVGIVPHVKRGVESVIGSILRDPYPPILGLIQIKGAFFKWILSQSFLGKTTYIPLHGPPGSSAIMQNPGDDEGYGSLIDPRARALGWKNLASVASVLPLLMYEPFRTVHQISCPALLVAAEWDTLCPAAAARQAFEIIRKSQKSSKLVWMDGFTHFDIYDEKRMEKILQESVAFLQTHLAI